MKNEEKLSKIRAIELWDKEILNTITQGTIENLSKIHSYLFQDIFDFAGEIRNVNISKGNFKFAPLIFLEKNLEIIDNMPESNFDEIIDKYVEMNVAHPFEDGNGTATRIWLDCILKNNLKKCVEWSKVDKYLYLKAMEVSVADTSQIKDLLKNSLRDEIDDRDLYLSGIQISFYYEDLSELDIKEIDKEIK